MFWRERNDQWTSLDREADAINSAGGDNILLMTNINPENNESEELIHDALETLGITVPP